ncbi:MAG: hypothetical protein JO008_04315 [Alphaproteobacteria bacterium]|nr:hypothetical protein [Alphaproteobacteria bacterium]
MRHQICGLGCVAMTGVAMLVLLSATPARAQRQGAPIGSYLQSCSRVGMLGERLTADCRRADDSWNRASLNVTGCVSGIANVNGWLTCDYVPGSGSSYDEHYRFPPYAGYGR